MGEHGLENAVADDVVGTLRYFKERLKAARLAPEKRNCLPLTLCGDDLEKLLHACDSLYRELEQAEATDE